MLSPISHHSLPRRQLLWRHGISRHRRRLQWRRGISRPQRRLQWVNDISRPRRCLQSRHGTSRPHRRLQWRQSISRPYQRSEWRHVISRFFAICNAVTTSAALIGNHRPQSMPSLTVNLPKCGPGTIYWRPTNQTWASEGCNGGYFMGIVSSQMAWNSVEFASNIGLLLTPSEQYCGRVLLSYCDEDTLYTRIEIFETFYFVGISTQEY